MQVDRFAAAAHRRVRNFLSLWVLLLCVACPAMADPRNDPFDARPLTWDEKRFIQAALAFEGSYLGLLDGAWGRRSQHALEAALPWRDPSQITFGDLVPILSDFIVEVLEQDWQVLQVDGFPNGLVLPFSLLDLDQTAEDPTLASRSGDLLVRSMFDGRSQTYAMHDWLVANHVGPAEFYQSVRADRIITSAQLASGKQAYLRSVPMQAGFVSTLVQNSPGQAARGRVIVASFTDRRAQPFDLPPRGLLRDLLSAAYAEPETPAGQAPGGAVGAPGTDRPRGSGTGFFVSATALVTAEHVIARCRSITLDDGTPLVLLGADEALDLAVLLSARPASSVLPLKTEDEVQLGAPAVALGYPLRDLFAQGLTVTWGNVSALARQGDPARLLMVTAPIQPGNSGGPLLDSSGQVIGVVVSRADDLVVLNDTGSLPQNINFAVSLPPLKSFLNRYGITLPAASGLQPDLQSGIPQVVQDAVKEVLCY